MILQDVQGQMLKCSWVTAHEEKEKEKALPAPRGTAYPRCLGNASCSPPQGAGGSNTRTKFVTRELLIHTSTEHRRCRNTGPGTQGGSSLMKDMKRVQAGTQTPQGRKFVCQERGTNHILRVKRKGGSFMRVGWLHTTYTDSLILPPRRWSLVPLSWSTGWIS